MIYHIKNNHRNFPWLLECILSCLALTAASLLPHSKISLPGKTWKSWWFFSVQWRLREDDRVFRKNEKTVRREGRVAAARFPHLIFLVQKLPFWTKGVEGWEGYDMSLGLLDDSNCHTWDLALPHQHHLFTSPYIGTFIPWSCRLGSSFDPTHPVQAAVWVSLYWTQSNNSSIKMYEAAACSGLVLPVCSWDMARTRPWTLIMDNAITDTDFLL